MYFTFCYEYLKTKIRRAVLSSVIFMAELSKSLGAIRVLMCLSSSFVLFFFSFF